MNLRNRFSPITFTRPLILAAMMATACGGDTGIPGQCPHDLTAELNSNFGNGQIDALLEATGKFSATATGIEDKMRTACNAIATDLGAASSDDTVIACMNATTAIDGVLAANATATLTVEFIPAVCSASLDAMVECAGECDASFDATATPPTCTGGELSGTCSGSCSGSCTVEASASCSGSCDASCSGSCTGTVSATCTGTCTGQCSGACSATGADGNCAGECTGTCSGECSGTIEGSCSGSCGGSCSGSCRAEASGTCEGSCSGGCDVDFVAPSCEGGSVDVEASAECQAACESEVAFDVECSEPIVIVSFTGAVSTELDALAQTLGANYGKILSVISQLEIVVGATVDLAGKVTGAASAAADIGLEAADCIRLAGQAQIAAAASINVSVMASVSVSGSVSSN